MERRLAAIFSTDVQGYSRLMDDDEEATIQTLKTYRDLNIILGAAFLPKACFMVSYSLPIGYD